MNSSNCLPQNNPKKHILGQQQKCVYKTLLNYLCNKLPSSNYQKKPPNTIFRAAGYRPGFPLYMTQAPSLRPCYSPCYIPPFYPITLQYLWQVVMYQYLYQIIMATQRLRIQFTVCAYKEMKLRTHFCDSTSHILQLLKLLQDSRGGRWLPHRTAHQLSLTPRAVILTRASTAALSLTVLIKNHLQEIFS